MFTLRCSSQLHRMVMETTIASSAKVTTTAVLAAAITDIAAGRHHINVNNSRLRVRTISNHSHNQQSVPSLASSTAATKSATNTIVNTKLSSLRMKETMTTAPPADNEMNNTFRFTNYDCIGFDLDNTICRYQISNMVKMEYEAISTYLVEEKNYSRKHLYKPIEDNLDFMLKGLILDLQKGNILRIDPNGFILHGSHGTTELTQPELIQYYGEDCRWEMTELFRENPLHTWNGPLAEKMRTLLDYFDMPAGLIFARLVDTLDEENGGKPLDVYNVWTDVVAALQDMFQREHFPIDKGGYFPHIKGRPEEFYHKCSVELMTWFRALKKHNKLLFLITGSNVDFASHTAENSMGKDWKELFDIIICFAKKPGFFTESRPFIGVDGFIETESVTDLTRGGIYTHGNWKGLHTFLKRETKLNDPKIVYVGDNLIQDVYTPAVHTCCDAVAVCEELSAEGVFGHEQNHVDGGFLTSKIWGSYFHHDEKEMGTIWKDIIRRHSKICVPSLEYVAQFPINQTFPDSTY